MRKFSHVYQSLSPILEFLWVFSPFPLDGNGLYEMRDVIWFNKGIVFANIILEQANSEGTS
jgi:hypothetical protein